MKIYVEPGMKICIGRTGENYATEIIFNIANWIELYGDNGIVSLLIEKDELTYPREITVNDNQVIWKVTNSDTFSPGAGKCELRYEINDVCVKTEIYDIYIMASLGEGEDIPPAPYQSWVEEVLDATAVFKASIVAPYIGENGYWYQWDNELKKFVNSGVHASTGESSSRIQSNWEQTDINELDYIKNKPTKLSAFENDLEYAKKSELPKKLGDLENDGFAKNEDIPTKTSQLENDSQYITLNDLPSVEVPTKVSQLENDSKYTTEQKAKEIVEEAIKDIGNTGDLTGAVRYDVQQILTNDQKKIARQNIGAGTSSFSGSYNDLTDKPALPESFEVPLAASNVRGGIKAEPSLEENALPVKIKEDEKLYVDRELYHLDFSEIGTFGTGEFELTEEFSVSLYDNILSKKAVLVVDKTNNTYLLASSIHSDTNSIKLIANNPALPKTYYYFEINKTTFTFKISLHYYTNIANIDYNSEATEGIIGGVTGPIKTDESIPVAIDENGRMWVKIDQAQSDFDIKDTSAQSYIKNKPLSREIINDDYSKLVTAESGLVLLSDFQNLNTTSESLVYEYLNFNLVNDLSKQGVTPVKLELLSITDGVISEIAIESKIKIDNSDYNYSINNGLFRIILDKSVLSTDNQSVYLNNGIYYDTSQIYTDQTIQAKVWMYNKLDSWYLSQDYEDKKQKVTSITSSSTNEQYPSAKAVYDIVNASQGKNEWEQIANISLEEDFGGDATFASFITNELNQNYSYRQIIIILNGTIADSVSSVTQNISCYGNTDLTGTSLDFTIPEAAIGIAGSSYYCFIEFSTFGGIGKVVYNDGQNEGSNTISKTVIGIKEFIRGIKLNSIINKEDSTQVEKTYPFAAGAKIIIYGRK